MGSLNKVGFVDSLMGVLGLRQALPSTGFENRGTIDESTNPITLGASMQGGNGKKRQEHDFYPTPQPCLDALMQVERPYLRILTKRGSTMVDPAAGDGAIIESFLRNFPDGTYRASDLIAREPRPGIKIESGVDYLQDFDINKMEFIDGPIDHFYIMNPPFKHASEFIEKALYNGAGYVACFLKQTFWNARSRAKLWQEHPPTVVYPLTWRADFMGLGRPTMDCCWTVWDKQRPAALYGTRFQPIMHHNYKNKDADPVYVNLPFYSLTGVDNA